VHVLDPDDSIDEADVTLFSLREDRQLLGIGVIKQLGPDHAELKSMHSAADARGRGVGRALVDHLVGAAAASGVRRLSLECGAGESFVPARSLYASAGFVPCEPFGGVTATSDVFMTRLLD
jgi:putative acetyltransferase